MRKWKIALGIILLLLVIVILIIFLKPSRQILVYSIPLCNISMEKTIRTLVERDLPTSWKRIFSSKVADVIVVNDMRCEAEYMANTAIILQDGAKIFFGIFHVHFSHQVKFISSAPVSPWKQYPDRNDPQIDAAWQDFVRTVYPEEMNPPPN